MEVIILANTFGSAEIYRFKRELSNYAEDTYNYYLDFPKSKDSVIMQVYKTWVDKYEKNESGLIGTYTFKQDELADDIITNKRRSHMLFNRILKELKGE